MTDDSVRRRMGWVGPGEDLPYKTRLEEQGQWPPGTKTRPPEGDERRPSTPYLCIPTKQDDVGDRENADASWIENGSLMLVGPDWNIEVAPRLGVDYRILAFVRNLGDAPALSAYVEFRVVAPPSLPSGAMGHDPLFEGIYMGVAALPIGSRETSWALSPRTWTPSDGHFDLGLCLAAKVVEPSRPVSDDWSAWSDRHVGLRNLAPDMSGTWAGIEMPEAREGSADPAAVIGEIRLSLEVVWPLETHDGPDPAGTVVWPRACIMTILAISPFDGRQIPIGSRYATNFSYGALMFEMPIPGQPAKARLFFLEMQSGGEIGLVTLVQTKGTPRQENRTEAKLGRTASGAAAPGVDPGLLASVNLEVGPIAPPTRREEARRLKAIRGR